MVVPGETDTQLLTAMVDRFDRLANASTSRSSSAALGLTPYQAITVASIVEKEGVIGKNLGPVARVILNRLANNMPLQMDSTVLYSEGRDGGPVTKADLAAPLALQHLSEQGTHAHPHLLPVRGRPPGHPPPTRAGVWLYFVVVQQDGTEAFADTFAEQQANEALAKQRGLG